jgi:hypothetical protein
MIPALLVLSFLPLLFLPACTAWVLDPVDAGRYSYDERDQLTSGVRRRIAAVLAEAGECLARSPEEAIGGVSA